MAISQSEHRCRYCGQTCEWDNPLIGLDWEGVEIDRCMVCGGTWLDSGELEWIARRAGVLDPGPLTQALASAAQGGRRNKSHRRCPRCTRRLEIIRVALALPTGARPASSAPDSADSPALSASSAVSSIPAPPAPPREIVLDRCPRGHGVWFDPGELETLVQSAAHGEGEAAAVARFLADLHRYDLLPASPPDSSNPGASSIPIGEKETPPCGPY